MPRIHDTFLQGNNTSYIIEIYENYCKDPGSVSPDWHAYFKKMGDAVLDVFQDDRPPQWTRSSQIRTNQKTENKISEVSPAVSDFIRAYRLYGHLIAQTDPLNINKKEHDVHLKRETYGITSDMYDKEYAVNGFSGQTKMTIRALEHHLQAIYCSRIGFEYNHINNLDHVRWLQQRIESADPYERATKKERLEILESLWAADAFERFLHVKYPGVKRFGLEGGESLIPGLEALIRQAVSCDVKRIQFGMAHRGRLAVMANILHTPLEQVLSHFQEGGEETDEELGSGDVKYHKGYSSQRLIHDSCIRLSLTPNPSHLEIINSVILGKVRAQQTLLGDAYSKEVLAILIHGDAAFIGQGSVAETFQLSSLPGYTVGGTVHVVVNNQVGFTTSPQFSRTSLYCTDIAKVVEAPVFHVNGDDPEAVTWVMRLAMDYRQTFKRDVVVDLVCYRRHGHNEIDEPSFTQPLLYKKIAQHPSTYSLYKEKLLKEKIFEADVIAAIEESYQLKLQEAYDTVIRSNGVVEKKDVIPQWLGGFWSEIKAAHMMPDQAESMPVTGVSREILTEIGLGALKVPAEFKLHQRLSRVLTPRKEMYEKGEGLDWASAEALAFGSLLLEGVHVRLSGQDCGRGTFSHRHMVWVDQETEQKHLSLNCIREKQAVCEVLDSSLSELAVMGFEYGYSAANPKALVMWEAQFGDFSNGAQMIVDQFISAGESKWQRLNGLVLLLPHGYEGQGPEHSSCRLERYLQLCAEENMYVANCSTPANYFHILRRQVISPTRKPLILVTPKSLLRHKLAVSSVKDMESGTCFIPVIEDSIAQHKNVTRVVLCSGKVYYELLVKRKEMDLSKEIALIRLEQFYPFPEKKLKEVLEPFAHAKFIWCQEEPKNMGAWCFLDRRLESVLKTIQASDPTIYYAGRPEAASPATGNHHHHEKEQALLLEEALKS